MTEPAFYDHEVVRRSPADYVEMRLSPSALLKAWSLSMFAHEMLANDGTVKPVDCMNTETLEKLLYAQDAMKKGEAVAKPIIGVGIMDNIEIGIGREIVVAAQTMNIPEIPVHARQAQAREITKLMG